MGILGIRIQRKIGLPIYSKNWSNKLLGFEISDNMLQSGFMTAIFSFAESLKHKIGYIRFYPENNKGEPNYGIDTLISLRNEIVFILFLEPYIFKNYVELKIDWIYELVIKNYEQQFETGKKIKFTTKEQQLIEDILFDNLAKEFINKRRNKIDQKINDDIIKIFQHEEIMGLAICSFDNSILYTYNIKKEVLEEFLNNMGLITEIKEWETQYKPIWIPNKKPVLVSVINSAMQVPIIPNTDIIDNNLKIPHFYYIVSSQDTLLGPLTYKLISCLNTFFLEKEQY